MAFALVGTIGAASQGASGAAVTPAWGTSETRVAGHLLICFTSVTGSAVIPTTPAGWTIAKTVFGTSCSVAIFYKIAAGSDAAPTIAAITSGVITAQLGEWSGSSGIPLDQTGSATGTTSPVTATQGAADAISGDLLVMAGADFRSAAAAPNDTLTSNNATITAAGNNNGTNSVNHYSFGYGTTVSAAAADTAIMTLSVTTNITGLCIASVSFRTPFQHPSAPTGSLSFVGAAPKTTIPSAKSARLFLGPSIAQGLISYWHLEEAAGTTRYDSGSAGNDLTDNGLVHTTPGVIGTAAFFILTSGNSYLERASNASLQMSGNTDFSISAWVKLTSLPGTGAFYFIAAKDIDTPANSREYSLGVGNASPSFIGFVFTVFQGGSNEEAAVGTMPSTGVWYHLVGWYDSSNGQAHLRVNDTTTYDSPGTGFTGLNTGPAPFRIGAGAYAGAQSYMDGAIDEVGLWKRKLTAAEITALYNSGSGFTAPLTNLLSRLTQKLAPAALSFAGAILRTVSSHFKAVLSFVGTILKSTARGLSAILSFAGSFTPAHLLKQFLTATLSFAGAVARQVLTVKTAALSFVGAFTKQVSRALGAVLSFVGSWVGNKISAGHQYYQTLVSILFLDRNLNTTPNLISYWMLDESSGIRYDSFGSNNLGDPTSVGSTTGIINLGANFVGASSQYLNSTSTALQMGSTSFTITCWVKFNTLTGTQPIFAKDSATYREYELQWNGSQLLFYVFGSPGSVVSGPTGLSTGVWYFVVAAYDFSTGTAYLQVNRGTWYSGASGGGSCATGLAEFRLGGRQDWGGWLDGEVDEVGVWKRVLTATEMDALYNSGNGLAEPYVITTPALLMRKTNRILAAVLSFAGAILRGLPKTLTAILSFIGTFTAGHRLLQTLTGALSFTGTFIKRTGKLFTAVLSFVGAIQRSIVHTMSAALNFIVGTFLFGDNAHLAAVLNFSGTLSRKISRILAGALSFVGNLLRQIPKSLTAALSFIGNLSRQIYKSLAATLNLAGLLTLAKSLHQVLTAALSFIGSLNVSKVLHQTYAATLSFIGSLSMTKLLHQTLTATLQFVGALTLVKALGRILTATLSFAGALTKSTSRLLTASLSFIGALLRRIPADLTAALSFACNLFKRTGTLRTAVLSFVGALSRLQGKVLTASLGFIGAWGKSAQKALAGVLSFIGALPRFIRSTQASVLSFVGALNAAAAGHIYQTLTSTLSFSGSLSRAIKSHYTAALSFVGQLGRQIPQRLSAVLSFVGSLAASKMLLRTLTATLNFSGLLLKRAGKALAAILAFAGALNLRTTRVFTAVLSFIGSLAKQLGRQFIAVLSFIGSFAAVKLLTRVFTATLNFAGNLSKRLGKSLTGTLSFLGQFLRRIPADLFATLSFIGNLTKQTRKTLQGAVLSFLGAFAAFGEKTAFFQSNLSFAGNISKKIFRPLAATLSFIGAIVRSIPKLFQEVLSFIGYLAGNIPSSFAITLSSVLSFSSDVFIEAGKYLKIFVGQIIQVLQIRVLQDLLGINIKTTPDPIIEVKIAVPQDPLEIGIPIGDNPSEIKIQMTEVDP